jgi:membrane-associated phospholipid phosphatase
VADHTTIPFGARFWRLWRPVWRLRHKANGFLFPALLLFWVLLLISPYIVINRIAAWAEHTPVQEESIPPEEKLKVSRQDQRTAWDPKSLFRDSEGQFLDYKIPAIDWTIWFYLSLFGYYCAFFAAQKNDRGRAESLVMAQAWVVSSWIAYPIFALLPADIDLRWQLNMEQMTPLYQFLFKAFHTLDEPFNAWPCLHIAQSFVMASALARWWLQRNWTVAVWLLWPAWLGLCVSVMTTKQHFIWDTITGTLLGIGVWAWLMRPGYRHLDAVTDDALPLAKLG